MKKSEKKKQEGKKQETELWKALWQGCESSHGRNREIRVMQVVLWVYATGVRFCMY